LAFTISISLSNFGEEEEVLHHSSHVRLIRGYTIYTKSLKTRKIHSRHPAGSQSKAVREGQEDQLSEMEKAAHIYVLEMA